MNSETWHRCVNTAWQMLLFSSHLNTMWQRRALPHACREDSSLSLHFGTLGVCCASICRRSVIF